MGIVLRDVSDSDIARVCEVESAAYADNPLAPVFFPGPFPPDHEQGRISYLIHLRNADPTANYLQAYDEETTKLVAFAKWHIYDTPEAATAAVRVNRSPGPGENKEALEAFFGTLIAKKKEHMGGKPHLYLSMLQTDPAFQGRGAGSLLIKWGTEKADELGLPAYLESSPKGHRFYQRHGFKDLEVFTFDVSQYGGNGTYEEPLMIREPTKSA